MDLQRLQNFVAIIDAGSMSAAARAVHLTQPALSRGLKVLEEEVGAPLFERRGRRLVPTAAGRALLPRARRLLDSAARLKQEVKRAARFGFFDLRLGTIDSVACFLLPPILEQARQRFPDLHVKLRTGRSAELLEATQASDLDLAIVAYSGAPPDVSSRLIAPYALQYYGRRNRFSGVRRCTTKAELRSFPVVEISPPSGAPAMVPEEGLSYARTSTAASVKALILAGFGVGDLTDFMLSPAERKLLAKAKIPHDPVCGIYLANAPTWDSEPEERVASFVAAALTRACRRTRRRASR